MIKLFCGAMVLALGIATSAAAGQGAVRTQTNQCNQSQLKQMKDSVDTIRDPLRHEAAAEELDMAVALLQDNDFDGCMVHLTNASEYVTP